MTTAASVISANHLLASRTCSATCLLAFPASQCICRCGGTYHGALAGAEVTAAMPPAEPEAEPGQHGDDPDNDGWPDWWLEWPGYWPADGWWRAWWERQDPLAVRDILNQFCCPVLDPVDALGQALLMRRGRGDLAPDWHGSQLVWVQRDPGPDLDDDWKGGTWSLHAEIPPGPEPEFFDPAAEAGRADFLSALAAAGRCSGVQAGRSVRASGFAIQEEAQVAGAIMSRAVEATAAVEALRSQQGALL